MLAFDPGDLDLGDLDHWESGAIQFSENEGGVPKIHPNALKYLGPEKKNGPKCCVCSAFCNV